MKEGGELHTHYGCTYTCYGYAHYRPLLPTPPQVARRS